MFKSISEFALMAAAAFAKGPEHHEPEDLPDYIEKNGNTYMITLVEPVLEEIMSYGGVMLYESEIIKFKVLGDQGYKWELEEPDSSVYELVDSYELPNEDGTLDSYFLVRAGDNHELVSGCKSRKKSFAPEKRQASFTIN